jgi:tRNA-dihydrouridine synthase A
MKLNSHRFCVAPMMDWTDRHCRFFHRQLTRHALLYTEMVTADAIVHGRRERLLAFAPTEHPVALQLGGSDPKNLATAARIGAEFGYDEINLNAGCPSDRVQDGRFGACLMREPRLVGECIAAMKAATTLPVTVKCRLGVDDQDVEVSLDRFSDAVMAAGADALIVHARKAWLEGLSPRDNRDIPPLDSERVYRLKKRLNNLSIILNGGIRSIEEARRHLNYVDGVMMGRSAYENPELLLFVDPLIFGSTQPIPDLQTVIENLFPYIEREILRGTPLHCITRHLLGLFRSRPGARAFRRSLATEAVKPGAGPAVLRQALDMMLDTDVKLAQTAA